MPSVGGGVSCYVSEGRDVPPKGPIFQSLSGTGGILHCTNSEKGLKYTCLIETLQTVPYFVNIVVYSWYK